MEKLIGASQRGSRLIAIAVFLGLRRFLFDADSGTDDIITATATALGGLTIGGVAVMQYRKHKWAEYQAKLDEDSRTGERLSKAIEHFRDGEAGSKEKLHIRIGAIYELWRLAIDSRRDRGFIISIIMAFIKSYNLDKTNHLPQDVEVAAKLLSQMAKADIEHYKTKHPHRTTFDAATILSDLASRNVFQWEWGWLKAKRKNLRDIELKGADLTGANFKRAILRGANIKGANLAGANLIKTDLKEVLVNEETIFKFSKISRRVRFGNATDMFNEASSSIAFFIKAFADTIFYKTRFDLGVEVKRHRFLNHNIVNEIVFPEVLEAKEEELAAE